MHPQGSKHPVSLLTVLSLGLGLNHIAMLPCYLVAQVFNSTANGRVSAIECDMEQESNSMKVVVHGSGPLGKFTATVSGVRVRGGCT